MCPAHLNMSKFKYVSNDVNGILQLPCVTRETLDELQANFKTYSGDVIVTTYPKSGTTWMQQILKLITNGGVDDRSKPTRFTWIEVNWLQEFRDNAGSTQSLARLMQTHLDYSNFPGEHPPSTSAKFIYVARNPKDVAVSYYYHTLGFELYQYEGDWDDYFERFISGNVTSGDWFDHVLGWWEHKDADNILFLKFEDMKKNLREAVVTISEFIGYKLDPKVIDSVVRQSTFEYMRDNPATNFKKDSLFARKDGCVPFIRKGEVGNWKNHFSASQSKRLDEKYKMRMKQSNLDFDFD